MTDQQKSYILWFIVGIALCTMGLVAVGQTNVTESTFDPTTFPRTEQVPWTFLASTLIIPTLVRLIRNNLLSKLPKKYLVIISPLIGIIAEIAAVLAGAPQGGQLAAGGVAGIGTHQIARKWTEKPSPVTPPAPTTSP